MSAPACAVWLTGPPASGKTTLALAVARALRERGIAVLHLDSDALRAFLTPRPTYTEEERDWVYAVIAELAELAVGGGCTVLVSATAPKRLYRDVLRQHLGDGFVEVFVDVPLEQLRARDPKGLYAAAAAGAVSALPGVGTPYEPPLAPELHLRADRTPFDAMVGAIVGLIEARSPPEAGGRGLPSA